MCLLKPLTFLILGILLISCAPAAPVASATTPARIEEVDTSQAKLLEDIALTQRGVLEPIAPDNVEKLALLAELNSSCSGPVRNIAFTPEGTLLVVGSQPHPIDPYSVRVWDLTTGTERACLEGHSTAAVSPDGTLLALGGYDGAVQLWDIASGEIVFTLEDASKRTAGGIYTFSDPEKGLSFNGSWNINSIWSLAFSPDGAILTVGRGGPIWDPGVLDLYEVATGNHLSTDSTHRAVFKVAFSPDGDLLATAFGEADDISLRDPLTGKEEMKLAVAATGVAFSPDGNLLATSAATPVEECGWNEGPCNPDYRHAIQLWDAGTGEQLAVLQGPVSHVGSDIAISPDGRTIAWVSYPAGIWLWDIDSRTLLKTIDLPGGTTVAFSPDGTLLATGDWDGAIHLWGVSAP